MRAFKNTIYAHFYVNAAYANFAKLHVFLHEDYHLRNNDDKSNQHQYNTYNFKDAPIIVNIDRNHNIK